MCRAAVYAIIVIGTALTLSACAPQNPPPTTRAVAPPKFKTLIVWNGESARRGFGSAIGGAENFVHPQAMAFHSDSLALQIRGHGANGTDLIWTWFDLAETDRGTDVRSYKNLVFWALLDGPQKPATLPITLTSASNKTSMPVDLFTYAPALADGQWHEIVIPFKALQAAGSELDLATVRSITFKGQPGKDYNLFVDDLAFDDRETK